MSVTGSLSGIGGGAGNGLFALSKAEHLGHLKVVPSGFSFSSATLSFALHLGQIITTFQISSF
jgi:hypothetical protein